MSLLFLSLVYWLISLAVITYGLSNLNFHVTEVSLTKFNLTINNTLSYKLKAKIASKIPNKRVSVHYRVISALSGYCPQSGITASVVQEPSEPSQEVHSATLMFLTPELQPPVIEEPSEPSPEVPSRNRLILSELFYIYTSCFINAVC